MTTPKKLVHWALDMSFSGFGSPLSDASTEANSSSSLQYINSQLIAHGFTHSPGLSLDGLSKEDTDKVVKCLLGMLGQRVDDMSRTEDLTTKLRTLSYDHERMMSMYQAATERAANAEREMNVHKSRLACVCLTSIVMHGFTLLQGDDAVVTVGRSRPQAHYRRAAAHPHHPPGPPHRTPS